MARRVVPDRTVLLAADARRVAWVLLRGAARGEPAVDHGVLELATPLESSDMLDPALQALLRETAPQRIVVALPACAGTARPAAGSPRSGQAATPHQQPAPAEAPGRASPTWRWIRFSDASETPIDIGIATATVRRLELAFTGAGLPAPALTTITAVALARLAPDGPALVRLIGADCEALLHLPPAPEPRLAWRTDALTPDERSAQRRSAERALALLTPGELERPAEPIELDLRPAAPPAALPWIEPPPGEIAGQPALIQLAWAAAGAPCLQPATPRRTEARAGVTLVALLRRHALPALSAALLLSGVFLHARAFQVNRALQRAEQALVDRAATALGETPGPGADWQRLQRKLEQELARRPEPPHPAPGIELLEKLERALPSPRHSRIERLDARPDLVRIEGWSPSYALFEAFYSRLRKLAPGKRIDVGRTSREEAGIRWELSWRDP
jgi:hypothetical protein